MPKGTPNADAYKAQNLIRLITRLIFCWFVKEKGLIPGELFDSRTLAKLLKEGAKLDTSKDSAFYQAILQNLFFATLNQEMGKREFRKRHKDAKGRDPHRGITNLYRYQDAFADPKAFLRLMEGIPFLNGGLFECLDKVYRAEENLPDVRIDGFSDHPKNPLSVPDFLFFGDERAVDLSAAYGEKRYRQATVRGLIHTFGRYKFTITENTPLYQEVALDPELSGKVFENLLAAYNPETATTARKQTGSFYTPREIVDYMVDEALIAYLQTALTTKDTKNETRLRHLFGYTDEPHPFNKWEVKTLIAAIDNLKALDPACGSGAFPMGLLHKLVFILSKLDPHSEQWKQKQIAKASEIPDATVREKTLTDIEQAFAANELDYGRKLYLIENCIYGVDIQPIAVQIAKMRFFISLIVEQTPVVGRDGPPGRPHPNDDGAPGGRALPDNLGIRPLPNLETKFVAANTLIGIEKPAQQMLRNPQVDAKEAELRQVRERHFTARTPATKARCRELDAKLRAEIGDLLRADGFARETTEKLANWNPYDQNASADFFDPEWMFGLREGFDIVTGNPPYNAELSDTERGFYKDQYTSVSSGRQDTAAIFVELATRICRRQGVVSYILPYRLFSRKRNHGQFQCWLLTNHTLAEIIYLGSDVGFTANDEFMVVKVYYPPAGSATICVAWKPELAKGRDAIRFQVIKQSAFLDYGEINLNLLKYDQELLQKISGGTVALESVCKVRDGIVPHIRDHLVSNIKRDSRYVRFAGIAGHYTLQKYVFTCDELWLCYDINEAKKYISDPEELRKVQLREKEIFLSRKIITAQNSATLKGSIDEDKTFVSNSIHSTYLRDEFKNHLALEYLLALINSKLLNYFHDSLRVKATDLHPQILVGNLKKLPIMLAEEEQQQPVVALVKKILAAKRADPAANTSALEREIDERVYRLYGLTKEEVKLVEEGPT